MTLPHEHRERLGGVGRRRAALACAAWVALVVGCNSLLGNSDHEVAPEASSDGGGGDAGGKDAATNDGSREAGADSGRGTKDGGTESGSKETGTDSGGDAGPPSCAPGGAGMSNCGPGGSGSESCCTSLAVTGGTFDRSYDDVTYTNAGYPAAVSGFRLDKYEITVGRFRQFVGAVVAGWQPAPGSGKQTHLNGGKGLNAAGGGYETGWDSSWTSNLAVTSTAWTSNLSCVASYDTWTASPGKNESKPINCVTWYEAYAFCIWDGGFLPTEAEWNYSAAGGGDTDGGTSGQRAYPWSSPSTSTAIGCSHANYLGADGGRSCATGTNNVGSESPAGDGVFGQTDLAGNVWEWNLDFYVSVYVNPCTDCAYLTATTARVYRGGGIDDVAADLLASTRGEHLPSFRTYNHGARCARIP
jgi:formylglycine-generating enzyme required for sulfatase activity